MVNNELVYTDDNNNYVVIMCNVVEKLYSHKQITPSDLEAAGVLIGERRGNHIVIYEISEPGPDDIRKRTLVNRKGSHHQKTVNAYFEKSKGELQYLGEWHTHPEDIPSPSSTDITSWMLNIESSLPIVLLIVGNRQFWLGKKEDNNIIILNEKI
ncbi:Mov34/MPN/PAD-1 family protein [Morganella morganii]|uniref:CBASS system CD-NTase/cGAS isopeptidase Cap3 n=1 Tax=Morganella morganii TaxID=582 RepID=UPI00301BE5CD